MAKKQRKKKPLDPKASFEKAWVVLSPHLVAGFVLVLFLIWYCSNTAGALWNDETANLWVGMYRLEGELFKFVGHPPFGQALLGLPYHLTENAQGSRMLAAVTSVLTLALLYAFLAKNAGRAAALWGMILLGTSQFFTRFAVQAMLDTLLSFAALLSFVVFWNIIKREEAKSDTKGMFALGLCLALAVCIKYTGILFALTMALYLLFQKKGTFRRRIKDILPLALGFLLTLSILYLPYWRIMPDEVIAHQQMSSHHAVWDSRIPDCLKPLHETLYRTMPHLPGVVYHTYTAVGHHLDYLSRGHYILVKDRIYEYPPWWTFLYWWDWTLGLPAAMFAGLIIVGVFLNNGPDRRTAKALLFIIGAPFLMLSLLTMKSDFYVLPWLPLLIIGGILMLKRFPPLRRWAPLIVFLLLFIPPGGVFLAGKSIALDSGYDKATRFIAEWAVEHPGVGVLVFHRRALFFYITQEDYDRIPFFLGDPYRDPPYDKCPYIENRTYGLLIDYKEQPRFEGTKTYACSRELSTGIVEFGGGLVGFLYD